MTRPLPRAALLLAGERLIAERGPDVALRDVATAAGQRNNSAVHYHFGSRDGLINAIIEHRQEPLEHARMALLAELESVGVDDDIAALVAVLVRPLFDIPYADGSVHYARFLERVRDHPAVRQIQMGGERWPALRILTTRLHRLLTQLPPAARTRRLTAMALVLFTLLADYERENIEQSVTAAAKTQSKKEIMAMLIGLLTAPAPPADPASRGLSRSPAPPKTRTG